VSSASFAWLPAEENDHQIAEGSKRIYEGRGQNRGQKQWINGCRV